MVKELEITDWDPIEIAEMIEEEIVSLVPTWKKQSLPFNGYNRREGFNYEEEAEAEGTIHHPFYASSLHSSSQVSLPASAEHSSFHGIANLREGINISSIQSWLQGMFLSELR